MAFRNTTHVTAALALFSFAPTVWADEAAAIRGDSPEISFQSLHHDFGTVFRGEILDHSFGLKNSGKAALDLRSIHSACGCLNTQVKPRNRLTPGEVGKVSFEFDTSWFTGPVTRTITVDSNDPEHATTILEVEANIKEEIRAVPAIITLGEIDKSAPKPEKLNIEILAKAPGEGLKISEAKLAKIPVELEKIKAPLNQKSPETKILAVVASTPNIVLETETTPKGMRISTSFKSPLPAGPFREHITVWNTSTHMKQLVIPVVGEVVPKTRLSNSYIEFGAITPGGRSRRSVSLTSRLPDFKIESIQVDLKRTEPLKNIRTEDLVSTSVQPVSNTVTAELKASSKIAFDGPSVNISGSVTVRTNDPDSKEFKIPFFGVLTEESQP